MTRLVRVGAIVLVALVSVVFVRDRYWHRRPEVPFRVITKRELPSSVEVVAYAHEMNDNLFRTTHYWLLTGSASALEEIPRVGGFHGSEEAQHALSDPPDLRELFGISGVTGRVVRGYGSGLEREQRFLILEGGTNAVFIQ